MIFQFILFCLFCMNSLLFRSLPPFWFRLITSCQDYYNSPLVYCFNHTQSLIDLIYCCQIFFSEVITRQIWEWESIQSQIFLSSPSTCTRNPRYNHLKKQKDTITWKDDKFSKVVEGSLWDGPSDLSFLAFMSLVIPSPWIWPGPTDFLLRNKI